MRRAVFACHQESEGPARLGSQFARRGYKVERVDVLDSPLPALDDADVVVVMGAPYSVYDSDPSLRIADELAWIADAHERRIPLIGVCFGAQAIAAALGGQVEPAAQNEIGWHLIESDEPWLAAGPWFQWHGDRFEVPPGCREIARSPHASQAFVGQRVLGVQFHPEVDATIVADWLAGRTADEPEFARAAAQPAAIIAEAPARCAAAQPALARIVDHIFSETRWLAPSDGEPQPVASPVAEEPPARRKKR